MEKIIDIIDAIAYEKGISNDAATNAIKKAFINTAKKLYGEDKSFDITIDKEKKEVKLFQDVEVIADEDSKAVEHDDIYIKLSEAKEVDPSVELGDKVHFEISFEDLGRTAAATLHREIEYFIQREVEQDLVQKYQEKIGKIISGVVTRVDSDENTHFEVDEVKAILPRKLRIKGEKFRPTQTVKAILKRVVFDKTYGMYLELSRTAPKFLEELLRLEVPEIKDELVTIHQVARIPGERAKVALSSMSPKVDAIGSTVGVKGVRIKAVSHELKDENIDCVEFSGNPQLFITKALSPARINRVTIEEAKSEEEKPKAIVHISSEEKSKAIGKSGINIRLASMLTGYTIEIIEEESSITIEHKEEVTKTGPSLKDLFS